MFRKAEDMRYLQFLRRLHNRVVFDWYLEIGCRTGRSLRHVKGKTIAVDPFFQIDTNVIGTKPAFMAFQQTSDEFFASGVLERVGVRFGFSFLDGMHLMEFLLRDFINTETASRPGAVIAMHDCCPYDFKMTTRKVEEVPRGAWTGDVWKLIPILEQYRPDLKITVLGCQTTGLVLVAGLDPRNTALRDNYDKILLEWKELTLKEFGVDRFFDRFAYTTVAEIEASDYAMFSEVRLPNDSIRTPEFVSP
jgi:hypothetical protein